MSLWRLPGGRSRRIMMIARQLDNLQVRMQIRRRN